MIDRTREQEVWSRVMAASAQAPAPASRTAPAKAVPKPERSGLTEDQLQLLLSQTAADGSTYRSMAARAGNGMRQPLERISMEKRDHYRQLAAVYYLMTGRRPQTEQPKASGQTCTPEALRTRYQTETEHAARYRSLAEHAGSYSGTFRDLGDAGERHAQMLMKMLQSWM